MKVKSSGIKEEFHEQEVLSVINAEEDEHVKIFWKASLFDDRNRLGFTSEGPSAAPHT